MEIIKLRSFLKTDEYLEVINKSVKIIKRGGTVVCPTDTVYGILANADDQYAVRRIFKIKKRPFSRPLPLLIKDIEMAKQLAWIDARIEKILKAVWPGAVTVVLNKKKRVPDIITAGRPTVALRISKHFFIEDLFKFLTFPLIGTSANISGEGSICNADDIIKNFNKEYYCPDLVLDNGLLKSSSSTILDLTTPSPKISRVGPVNKEELLKILEI